MSVCGNVDEDTCVTLSAVSMLPGEARGGGSIEC